MWLISFIAALLVNTVLGPDLSIPFIYPDNAYDYMNFTTKCFGDLGCFYTGPPWYHPLYRPVTHSPQELHTDFLLFTRFNKDKPYNLTPTIDSLSKSSFNDIEPIIMFVPGWIGRIAQFTDIIAELLRYSSFNVIVLDWTRDAKGTYAQSIANARLVGAYAAKLLNFITSQTSLKPEAIHLVGHSLGGQLVGYIGERVRNLGRITGLDPSNIYFEVAPREVRLDSTDANFVDIIVTNRGDNIFKGGTLDEIYGHAVFTVNGGYRQPGCIYDTDALRPIYKEAALLHPEVLCSHQKPLQYFQYSINTCNYTALACFSYEGLKQGFCNNTPFVNVMGLHAVKPPYLLNYFLDTVDKPPYCKPE